MGTVLACLVLATVGVPGTAGSARVDNGRAIAVVTDVIDGDTITVQLGRNTETVRLLGIDTPESAGGPRPAECGGAEATAFAKELVGDSAQVWLERDAESRDQYGRVLAYVFRLDDGLFINQQLVESGHATATFYEPNTTWRAQLTRAELLARRDGRGFWGTCGGPSALLEPS